MAYRVVLSKSAAKELDAIPSRSHDKIVEHLRQLEANPRIFGSEKLTGIEAFKLSVGSFRIIYEINDSKHEVRVSIVEDRKQVYKRLKRKR